MRSVVTGFLFALSSVCLAGNIDQLQNINQGQFRLLSEDLGAALSYKPLAPAAPLGIAGFDIGAEVSATKLRNPAILDQATSGNTPSWLVVPRIEAQKGLPFDIDIGLTYSKVPGSNIDLWGGELRYAILEGSTTMPAIAVRGSYTKLTGVDQLDFSTKGLDLSVSKGFLFISPYAGLGKIWVSSTPKGVPTLSDESFSMNKFFGGANIALGVVSFDLEADRTGDAWTYSGKLALRF
ncbi:MAG TPA: hypothetical protein VFB20_14235 [Burkholderiales bacterium]|nr:hypothetical protein [Burkholderiales bacterium]